MKKALKVLLIGIISLLLLAGITSFIISYFYSDALEEALIEQFEKQTDQKYDLSLADFDVGLLRRTVSADSIYITPNKPSAFKSIEVTTISINQIQWLSWLNRPFPNFGEIVIDNPHVELMLSDNSSFDLSSSSDSSNAVPSDSLPTFNFVLNNGSGVLFEEGSEQKTLQLNDISLTAEDVDLHELLSRSDVLFMDNLHISGSGLTWFLHENFYEFQIDSFEFDKNAASASLENLTFTPTLPKYEFSQQRGYQLDRITLNVPEINLRGFNLDSITEKHFELDSLTVRDASLEVFRSKQIPRPENEGVKPLLYEVATASDFSFGLNNARVYNSNIRYEEHRPPSDSTGSVSFNDLTASLYNFKTAAHPDFEDAVFEMDVETLFMDVAPLSVQVDYPLANPSNTHTVQAQLESIDPKEVGGMLRNVGFVELEDGFVEGLDAEIELNSESSTGDVLVRYRDLKVKFLNKDDPDDPKLKQRLKNFVANTFAINANNTGDDAETGTIDFDREKNKSIFAYWWKSLLSGMKDVIQ